MRTLTLTLVLAGLAIATVFPDDASALTWPKAILAVANVDDVTTAANGNEVAPTCLKNPCIQAGVPTVVADVECYAATYGCPFLWEGLGRVYLRLENLDNGHVCEGYFGSFPSCGLGYGLVRFTLTAETTGSESVIAFH